MKNIGVVMNMAQGKWAVTRERKITPKKRNPELK